MPVVVGPGSILRCICAHECNCGDHRVTEGALYTCEDVEVGFLHSWFCTRPGCVGALIWVRGKPHGFCATLFAPLDEGDDAEPIEGEAPESYDDMLKPDGPLRGPALNPGRVEA